MKNLNRLSMLMMVLFASVVAMAQVTTASLSGVVSDDEGFLPGAVVTAVYEPTGLVYHDVVDANGAYQFLNVNAGGPYQITVQNIGYRTLKVTDIFLNLADNNKLDLHMQEESFGLEEIVVAAKDMSSMSSDRAGSITAVSAKTIALLPTTSRSINDALTLTPQASTTTNGLAVGGGNYRQSNVTVDGAAFNNSFGIGQNLPAGGSPISLDAMDQLAISITPYDVRQSGFVGGAIQATTKSGTNDWKFSVYDYFQHKALQGTKYGQRDLQGNYPKALQLNDMLKNTIGATVGGPIVKDKLFFFLNFEYDIDNNPGQSKMARPDGVEMGGQYNRPTEEKMNMISKYLQDKYNYNPGAYQGYSFNTPDWKIFARLDWNINSANRLTLRYSYTANKYMTSPSSSVSPFGSTALYDRNSYGRTSKYALYFQNANYYQEQNFSSLAGELNSRFLDGKLTNMLRATWSHQYEPRSYNGNLFPTVDILENIDVNGTDTRAVYTTFGIDPFTYGNLRDVNTISVADEIGYKAGKHSITAGVSFDYSKAKNGYMQMGAGYYMYGSWDDFVNDAAPLAFAITHANRTDLKQQFPTLSNMNLAIYAQDEVKLNKKFNLTYGIRFDLPMYPALKDNENKAFSELFEKKYGWRTDNTPATYLNVSPRIGFNWDILGNRKLILRGGTGYFVGNIPMVWLVSAVGNANTMQAQTLLSTKVGETSTINMHFHDNIDDILKELYNGKFEQKDLAAPSSPTILAKDLRMPSTWKTSLAIDGTLPGDVKVSVEGIFNKDINSIVVTKEGLKCEENGLVMAEGIDVRNKYTADPDAKKVTPYLIHNAKEAGYYASVTAKVEKVFPFGLSLMAAYTYSNSKSVNDGLGDQVTSVFSTNTFAKNGSNESGLGYASYVSPHRLVANISYVIKEGNHASTALSLFYEGSNVGYIGNQYSYTRWTPTMSSNVTGDGGSYNTIYVPTEAELEKMNFTSEANKADFNRFINEHKELNAQRGHYAQRGSMTMPWRSQLNFKLMQNINFADASGRKHNVEIGWDVKNLLNLLNREWGNYQTLNNTNVLSWKDGVYTYNPTSCQFSPLASTASTWSMMLSLKYYF